MSKRSRFAVLCVSAVWLAVACATAKSPDSSAPPPPASVASHVRFTKAATLGPGMEWRFYPIITDVNRDGHLDIVNTARLVPNGLNMLLGDGKLGFTAVRPTWKDPGYGGLASGDINGDGYPDFIVASHFERVHTLLSDGKGGFTDTMVVHKDGYVGAQLVDLNGDGHLDLVLLGFIRAGLEIYWGDGKGNWTLHTAIQPSPGRSMPGRAVLVTDLNKDGHLDIIAVYQRWGVYIYYGDSKGNFRGARADFYSSTTEYQAVAVGDVNGDGHLDIIINGAYAPEGEPEGPDVYLSDGRGGWRGSSKGLKVLKLPTPGLAVADVDGDGHLDIIAGGSFTGIPESGYGLFWFKGDGKGNWEFVRESGFPTIGLTEPQSITLRDLNGDGIPEVVTVHGWAGGLIVWKRQ